LQDVSIWVRTGDGLAEQTRFMRVKRRFAQPGPYVNRTKAEVCRRETARNRMDAGISESGAGDCTTPVSPGCAWAALDWWI